MPKKHNFANYWRKPAMFRLYAQYDTVAVRTARRYKQFQKAIEVAKTIKARFVEVRLLSPNGTEHLKAIIRDGQRVGT
jgi:hypothetical protein